MERDITITREKEGKKTEGNFQTEWVFRFLLPRIRILFVLWSCVYKKKKKRYSLSHLQFVTTFQEGPNTDWNSEKRWITTSLGVTSQPKKSLNILFFYSPCLHEGRKPLLFGGHKYFLSFQFSNWADFSTTIDYSVGRQSEFLWNMRCLV